MRSGFVCIVGRPNAGKSTLTNAMVGRKVAITSSKPQTTRHTVRGIITSDDAQLVLVDTPGVHRPRTLLGERLNAMVSEAYSDVDVIAMCIPADEAIGPGDRFIASQLAAATGTVKVAVVTKADIAGRQQLGEQLLAVSQLARDNGFEWQHIVPVSAVSGEQVDLLTRLLTDELPEGPLLYPEGEVTDEPDRIMVAELIREAALEGVRDELPHSIAVVVDEMELREGREKPLMDIFAIVYVERDSQKHIVIGKGGSRLKDVGTTARTAISELLGVPVHLDLRVKVAKEWQQDPKQLDRLGF